MPFPTIPDLWRDHDRHWLLDSQSARSWRDASIAATVGQHLCAGRWRAGQGYKGGELDSYILQTTVNLLRPVIRNHLVCVSSSSLSGRVRRTLNQCSRSWCGPSSRLCNTMASTETPLPRFLQKYLFATAFLFLTADTAPSGSAYWLRDNQAFTGRLILGCRNFSNSTSNLSWECSRFVKMLVNFSNKR